MIAARAHTVSNRNRSAVDSITRQRTVVSYYAARLGVLMPTNDLMEGIFSRALTPA